MRGRLDVGGLLHDLRPNLSKWKADGRLEVSEVCRMNSLEDENWLRKKLLAEAAVLP